jgi:hypothetical protein
MQPCTRIHHSTVRWRLNMFRAAYCSSSGALTIFAASGLHTHVVTGRSQVWLGLDYGRSPHAYVNQRLQIQLQLLMMSGMPLETCWAFDEGWSDEFWYRVASCWLFLLSHIMMHGSINIKLKNFCPPPQQQCFVFFFSQLYRASWYYQSFITNRCTTQLV